MLRQNNELHKAALNGDVKQVTKLLTENAADVNAVNRIGETPLMVTAKHQCEYGESSQDHLDVMKLLLAHGANPNLVNESSLNETALGIAVSKCCPGAVELLYPVTSETITKDRSWWFGILPDPNDTVDVKLSNWLRIVETLENYGVDFKAIWSVHEPNFLRLFPSGNGGFNMADASGYASIDFILSHLDKDKIAADSIDLLHMLIRSIEGKEAFNIYLDKFIKAGLDIHARESNNQAAIHQAVICNKISAVEALVEHGADVNSRGVDNLTPLHFAAAGNPQITKYLLTAGADSTLVNDQNQDPIKYSKKECNDQEKCRRFSKSKYLKEFQKKYHDAQKLIITARFNNTNSGLINNFISNVNGNNPLPQSQDKRVEPSGVRVLSRLN